MPSLRACIPSALVTLLLSTACTLTAAANPPYSQEMRESMKAAINRPAKPLHILYLHGIGAQADNDSLQLRTTICLQSTAPCTTRSGTKPGPDGREFADLGPLPSLAYLGKPIWNSPIYPTTENDAAWKASRPFVDHWVIERTGAPPILVDEINWWPLMLILKCRNIMPNEALLAGADKTDLGICSGHAPPKSNGNFQYHPYITDQQAVALENKPRPSALANRFLKNETLDWGFSDALSAVGPLRDTLLKAIRQLLVDSVAHSGEFTAVTNGASPTSKPEYFFVSHSLGSYLVFNALNFDDPALTPQAQAPGSASVSNGQVYSYILQQTSTAYFLANQVPLLELASLQLTPGDTTLFTKWSAARKAVAQPQPQIVAWSDPSDLLSWWVPDICGVGVTNITIKNSPHILWLFEWPPWAHDNYSKKQRVVKSIIEKTPQPELPSQSNDAIPTAPCPAQP